MNTIKRIAWISTVILILVSAAGRGAHAAETADEVPQTIQTEAGSLLVEAETDGSFRYEEEERKLYIYGGTFGGKYSGTKYSMYIKENPIIKIRPSDNLEEHEIEYLQKLNAIPIWQPDDAEILEAASTSGSVSITAADGGAVKANSTSGRISVTLAKMDSLEIDATSGSVTALLPAEPGFTAHVGTTSGKFTYDLALSRDGNDYVCGDGSVKVDIDTTSSMDAGENSITLSGETPKDGES